MEPAAFPGRIVHPYVVDVGDQDSESCHELPAVGRPRRQETALRDVRKLEGAGRDVTGVNDPVVAEEGRMILGRRRGGSVTGKGLEGRVRLDEVPEPLLENRPDVSGM